MNNIEFINKVIANCGDKYSFEKTNYLGSDKNVIITCKKHNFDIEIMASTILRKPVNSKGNPKTNIVGSCPICREEYFDTIKNKLFEKFKKIHNNEYTYEENEYINVKTPFNAICKKHGKFLITGEVHIKGQNKCPKCRNEIKYLNHRIINGKKYFICDIHGEVLMGKHRTLSSDCPECAIEKQNIINENLFINNINSKYADHYIINFINDNINFVCKKHNTVTIINRKNIKSLKKHYCDTCRHDLNIKTNNESKIIAIDKIKQILNINYSHIYKYIEFIDNGTLNKSNVKLYNILIDKEKIVKANSILDGDLSANMRFVLRNYMSYDDAKIKVQSLGITNFREYKKWHVRTQQTEIPSDPQREYTDWISYCDFFGTNPNSRMSWGEKKIDNYLQRKNINYVWQKRFIDCKDIRTLPFDFYLPDHNLIIEYDGEQHYKPTGKYTKEMVDNIKKHDEIKNNYCLNKKINIIRVNHNDMINNMIEWILDDEISKINANLSLKNILEK